MTVEAGHKAVKNPGERWQNLRMVAEEMERRGGIKKVSWRQNQQNLGTGQGQREEPGLQTEKWVNSDVISWDTSSYEMQLWCGRGKMVSMLEIMNLFGWMYGSRDEGESEEILIWELSATNHHHLNIFDISYLRHLTASCPVCLPSWRNTFNNHKISPFKDILRELFL